MHCLVCLNGDYGEISRYDLELADMVICADGGTNYAQALGIIPDLIIGDMDSIAPTLLERLVEQGIEVQAFAPEKDDTDAQLAIQVAIARGADRITVLGGTGKRLDHTWSVIMSMVTIAAAGVLVKFYHPEYLIYLLTERLELQGNPGDIVSLLALTPVQGVSTYQLKYPLKQAQLLPERPFAISNQLLGKQALIELQSGVLMVVHITT